MNMKRPAFSTLALLALLILLVTILAVFDPHYYPGITPQKMQDEINASVPKGAHFDKVSEILSRKHIEHSDYRESDRRIHAIIRKACWSILFECNIVITFTFDADGNLVNAIAEEGLIGP